MNIFKRLPKWTRITLPSLIIVFWLVLAGVGGPYFGKISEVSSTDLATFLPKSAESTKVNEELKKFRSNENIPLIVVFDKADAVLSTTQIADINKLTQKFRDIKSVNGVISPAITSEDGKAAFIVIPFENTSEFKKLFPEIKNKFNAEKLSVDYKFSGAAAFAHDLQGAFAGIDGTLLLVALSVVFIILLIVYRSVLLPVIVLFVAISALAAAIFAVYHLAKAGVVELNGQVQGILFILVIGAATDYSLLYIARYKEELHNFKSKWQATKAALGSSYEPILAAGGTVMIGLMCLLLSDLASNKALGPVGAIGIGLSVISVLTFLPALLLLIGRASFWPRIPSYQPGRNARSYEKQHSTWQKIGAFVQTYPRRIWIGSLVLLGVASAGLLQLRAEGVSQSDLVLGYSEAREGQEVLNAHFPAGSGSPAYVIVNKDKATEVTKQLKSNTGVDSVSAITEQTFPPTGTPKAKSINERVVLQATLKDEADSLAARQVVVDIRNVAKSLDTTAIVGGVTAVQYDTNQAALHDQKLLIPAILSAITIVLMLLLRSIIAPMILLFTTVLSFGATLGISAVLFNHMWNFPGADPSVVIFGFVFLVALGIDYNIFLMTRVREETLLSGVRKGTIKGLVVTGGVITSAGVVLAATFAALGVIPILFLVQLAFIVAFGVLLDTILVRSLLVPSLTLELGDKMWWPSKKKR